MHERRKLGRRRGCRRCRASPEGKLNETVLAHVREAYRAPEMAAFKDYLDFLVLAVIANANIDVPVPGETEDAKDVG